MRLTFLMAAILLTACGPAAVSHSDLSSRTPHINPVFPEGPQPELTPGTVCTKQDPTDVRPGIVYCGRKVSKNAKQKVIDLYDNNYGSNFRQIEQVNRNDFKIDHFIPLCIGGSNEATNLWPQYKTLYGITDSLEQKLCNYLNNRDESKRITQAEAIRYVRYAKIHIDEAEDVEAEVDRIYGR